MLAHLIEAGDWLWTKEACPPGDDYKADLLALDVLLAEGLITRETVQHGRSRGVRWRAV